MKISSLILLLCLLLQGCSERPSTAEPEIHKAHVVLGFDRSSGEQRFRSDVADLAFLFDGPGLPRDGKLFFVGGGPDKVLLLNTDTKTGKVGQSSFPASTTSTDGRAFPYLARRGLVEGFDPNASEVSAAPKVDGLPLASVGTTLYSATPDDLIAYDTQTWEVRWEVKLAGVSHLAANEEGEVAAVNPNGCRLYSADGKELWKVDTPFQPSGVALSGDAVLVGTAKPRLWALDRKSGEKKWDQTWDGGANGWARPRVIGDLVAFPVGSNLEAFDIASGEKKWTFEGVGSAVGVDPEKGQFFVISGERNALSCVDASNGKAVWTTQSDIVLVGPPSFDSDGVYLFGVVDAKEVK